MFYKITWQDNSGTFHTDYFVSPHTVWAHDGGYRECSFVHVSNDPETALRKFLKALPLRNVNIVCR